MPDDTTTNTTTGKTTHTQSDGKTGGTSGTTADPKDIAVVVPDETKQKFPDLVELILLSKSMNNQERNYWLQVLPVMTEEQVAELRDILDTEKRKLAEIEKKYGKKKEPVEMTPEKIKELEEQKRKEREQRMIAEKKAQEEENPDDILASLWT